MTITLAELQADREAGTPGPWKADGPDPFGDYNVNFSDNENDCRAILAVVSNLRCPGMVAANARRAARLPDTEAALIEAVGVLREALSGFNWINIQAENAMATSAGAATANGDADGALEMLNSIASDIGINATMQMDKGLALLAKLGADK